VNGYAYIDTDYHCMVCDDPSNCSNCDEIRVVPWVQDYPSIFIEGDYTQESCEENDFEWGVGNQLVHYDMDQIECEENNFTWVVDYPLIYNMDEAECEENGYLWFHGECIDLDGEVCIEDVYGCTREADVWGNWDITLRDLVIVNRQGYEVARVNLTPTNPDPNSTCGENYQTIKDLIISAR